MCKASIKSCCLLFFVTASLTPRMYAIADGPRLNQIQVIGTHNSYHIAPSESVMELLATKRPELAKSLDYSRKSLTVQLERFGMRQLELDVYADPQGGLFAKPMVTTMVTDSGPPHDPLGILRRPGLKVLHIPDIDYRTTVLTFVDALLHVKEWSQTNPSHCPILVLIEAKRDSVGKEFTQPRPFDSEALDSIDREILTVFARDGILMPDDVRGEFDTLRDAVLERGWPYLDDVRGRVMFALDNEGEERDIYLRGHPTLRKRVLFVSVPEDHAAAAFMKINDSVNDFRRIQRMVKKGFLVRTRADSNTVEARINDNKTRDMAFASGAHFISTDYPEPDRRWSSYYVRLPQEVVARSNPVCGEPEWQGRDLEKAALGR